MTYVLQTDFDNPVYTPYGGAREFMYATVQECIIGGPAETGKTLAACWKSHILASKYPGCQGAIVRKTQASVYGSVLQTFERVIKGAPVKPYGGTRPEQYIYANGSIIWVGGMDNPDKLLSSERDFVQVNQTEELKLDDWEKIMTRVTGRAGNVRHPQVFGDCNPAGSKHWIRARGKSGSLHLIVSTHKDNPTLFDPETGAITLQGERTMEILNNLTGVRRKRLLEGIWATAEGAVYDMFDGAVHVQARNQDDFRAWVMGMDEGYTNPAVILLVGIDGDGRMHVQREFYRRGVLQSAVVAEALFWNASTKVEDIAVDNSAAGLIADLVDARLPARGQKGRVLDGITAIQNLLKVQGDDRPRLTIDPACVETINEFESYVWKPEKDEPVKEHDHAMDALRYVAAALGMQGAALEYALSPTAGYRG
jgi:PBSX family phage terminase large subunit